MRKDRLFVALGCVLLLAALTGCSGSEISGTVDSSAVSETTASAETETTAQGTERRTHELTFHGYAFELPGCYRFKDKHHIEGVDTMAFYVPDEESQTIVSSFTVLCEDASAQNLTQQMFEENIDQIMDNMIGATEGTNEIARHTGTVSGETVGFCDVSSVLNDAECIIHYLVCYHEQNQELVVFTISHLKSDDTYAGDLDALAKTVTTTQ